MSSMSAVGDGCCPAPVLRPPTWVHRNVRREFVLGWKFGFDVTRVNRVVHCVDRPRTEREDHGPNCDPRQRGRKFREVEQDRGDRRGSGNRDDPGDQHLSDDFPVRTRPDPIPAPTTELAAACVVEIGIPIAVAPKIALEAPIFAAAPEAACSVVIFKPMVSMIFQPPHKVPERDRPVGGECHPFGHLDRSAGSSRRVAAPSKSAPMTPMVFCASFAPWPKRQGSGRDQLKSLEDRMVVSHLEQPLEAATEEHREDCNGDRDRR